MSLDPHNLSIVFFQLRFWCIFECMPSIISYVCNMYMYCICCYLHIYGWCGDDSNRHLFCTGPVVVR